MLSCKNIVFERLLRNQVATKYDNCFGDGLTTYRKRNSCETTLIGLVEDWKLARDNRLLVGTVFCDCLSKPDLHLYVEIFSEVIHFGMF